jgi:hypothetical protein
MFDNVLVTIAIILASFFGFVLPWLRRRAERWRRERRARSAMAPEAIGAVPVGVSPLPTVVRPVVARPASPRPPAAARVRPAAGRRRRGPLGSLSDVRRGVVMMTLLGPCRALEPPRDGERGERG